MLGVVHSLQVELVAEAYSVDVDVTWPEEGVEGLDFKAFKVAPLTMAPLTMAVLTMAVLTMAILSMALLTVATLTYVPTYLLTYLLTRWSTSSGAR